MADIDRYRPGDRSAVDALYRRVFGDDATEAYRRRWEWLYTRNPNLDGVPLIWLAREGDTIVGQYATMPVRLLVNGQEIDAAWGMDVMVAPERQRQGLGEALFRTWDRHVGAALGLSLTDASHALFGKLRWPDLGRVPRLAKPLSRHLINRWRQPRNPLAAAVTLPWGRITSRLRPLDGEIRALGAFDESATRLWARVAAGLAFAVRRDATYLNWKFVEPPHVRYSIAGAMRGDEMAGYVVYRHSQEADRRVTMLVDFLVDPAQPAVFDSLLRWVDREAYAARSDLIRVFATHAGYRAALWRAGYHVRTPSLRFVAKINAVEVPLTFYDSPDQWHVTMGDSDVDR